MIASLFRSGRWLRDLDRLNKHIHLLAHEDWQVASRKTKDHLDHPRIDALGAVAGERFLRHHVRFEMLEGKRSRDLQVAAQVTDRLRTRSHEPGIVFVHVHAHMQGRDPAQENQRGRACGGGGDWGKFAWVNLELHDFAVHGSAHRKPF